MSPSSLGTFSRVSFKVAKKMSENLLVADSEDTLSSFKKVSKKILKASESGSEISLRLSELITFWINVSDVSVGAVVGATVGANDSEVCAFSEDAGVSLSVDISIGASDSEGSCFPNAVGASLGAEDSEVAGFSKGTGFPVGADVTLDAGDSEGAFFTKGVDDFVGAGDSKSIGFSAAIGADTFRGEGDSEDFENSECVGSVGSEDAGLSEGAVFSEAFNGSEGLSLKIVVVKVRIGLVVWFWNTTVSFEGVLGVVKGRLVSMGSSVCFGETIGDSSEELRSRVEGFGKLFVVDISNSFIVESVGIAQWSKRGQLLGRG